MLRMRLSVGSLTFLLFAGLGFHGWVTQEAISGRRNEQGLKISLSKRDENEAIIKRYCEAWKNNDIRKIIDLYHDEFVLHYFGRSRLAGEHRGKAAVLDVLARVQKLTNRRLLEIRDVLASDAHAVVIARERFERNGRQREINRVLVYRIRDGKLAECWVYDDDQRVVDEFWK